MNSLYGGPHGKEQGKPLGPEKWALQLNSANNLNELGRSFLPIQASNWEHSPADTYAAVL